MSYLSHLECASGGARFPADRLQNNCCEGGDILEARYDMERLRREVRREAIARGPSPLWRHPPLLPAHPPADALPPRHRIRDYYRVEDTEGRRFWLYREGLYRPAVEPAWYLHGFFA